MNAERRRVLGVKCWVLVKEQASTQYLTPKTLSCSAERCRALDHAAQGDLACVVAEEDAARRRAPGRARALPDAREHCGVLRDGARPAVDDELGGSPFDAEQRGEFHDDGALDLFVRRAARHQRAT